MSYFQQTNNYGSGLITLGNYEEAISVLTCALKELHHILTSATDSVPNEATYRLECCTLDLSVKASLLEGDDQLYIFNRAIAYTPVSFTLQDASGISRLEASFYTSITLFNTALAYHALGKNNVKNSAEILTTACKLYEKSVQVADEVAFQSDDDAAKSLMIVALNNQAVIYHDLGDFTESFKKMKLFLDIIQTLHQEDDGNNSMDAIVDDESLSGLNLNMLFIANSRNVAAASA